MQGGRSISVIGASIASPPGVCLSILPVLQDASSREEAENKRRSADRKLSVPAWTFSFFFFPYTVK